MKKLLRLSLLLLLVGILGSAAFISYTVFFGGESVVVPPMVGSSVLDAVDTLENMGIKIRVDQEDSLQPRGTVIAQWPKSGVKINKEKILILKVSKGGYKEPLPDLRGMEFSRATSKLQELNFPLGDVVRVHDERPAGMIVAQNPAAPVMISRTKPVSLLVSLGPVSKSGKVVVPDILGKEEDSARKMLDQSGLSTSVRYVYTQASPPGLAISMSPRAGSTVAKGTVVTLKVSTMNSSARPKREEKEPVVKVPGSVSIPGTVKKPQGSDISRPDPVVTVAQPEAGPSPEASKPVAPKPQSSVKRKKNAKIRYQVPPVTKPLVLKIEMIDKGGSRVLVNKEVKGGEYISLNTPYAGDAAVTIYLGGEFVWQDRYR